MGKSDQQTKERRKRQRHIRAIEKVFTNYFEGFVFTEGFRRVSLGQFLEYLSFHDVEDAMYLACEKMPIPNDAVRYFCGICWKRIKRAEEDTQYGKDAASISRP